MSAKSMRIVSTAAIALVCLLVGLLLGAQWQGHLVGTTARAAVDNAPNEGAKAGDREVLYWHDPMVPGHRFDKPGKSPFMDMDLVPVYADQQGRSGVQISPGFAQNLGIRLAQVRLASLATRTEAVGTVAENERSVVSVQTRATGYIERLHVRATLDPVKRGQPLATLFVPEWGAALEEYLGLRAAKAPESLLSAAKTRMALLSIPVAAIAKSEAAGAAQSRFTITAPAGGIVTELNVREGMQAAPGMTLFRIADLSAVWVYAEVPEAQAGNVVLGASAEVHATAYPGQTFKGKVTAILPEVAKATRTVRARLEIDNQDLLLKPGMFVRISLREASDAPTLVVPQEAVIATGTRAVVVVASDDGSYQPVDVVLGRSAGGDVEVKSGLAEGQKVVASGQFLLDSEASLKTGLPRLSGPEPLPAEAVEPVVGGSSPGTITAEGVVRAVEPGALTISHGPIPALKWPGMTMDFVVPKEGLSTSPKADERIRFDFHQEGDDYVLGKVESLTTDGATK